MKLYFKYYIKLTASIVFILFALMKNSYSQNLIQKRNTDIIIKNQEKNSLKNKTNISKVNLHKTLYNSNETNIYNNTPIENRNKKAIEKEKTIFTNEK